MTKATGIIAPDRRSWIEVPAGSDFPIQNLPFGVGILPDGKVRCLSRIGDQAINLYALAKEGYFDNTGISDLRIFGDDTLNRFIASGREVWRAVRSRLAELFDSDNDEFQKRIGETDAFLTPVDKVKMQMPVYVPDYTDFYSSIEHATNVGKMFRDPENALLPNWKHIPVAYHSRSSSIVVSGTSIHRPKGQTLPQGADKPVFGPSRSLDFELEMAFITGGPTELGSSIPVDKAEEYIFGMVIFNDLSARDIQKWEYVPLGPFLGKNFGSVISPWVVTLDALEPFRTSGPEKDTEPLPYLRHDVPANFDIDLEVVIGPDGPGLTKICHSNFKYLYWSMAQQLAHHTVNGCNIRPGDMMASGTISGPTPESYGSMLELSWKGTRPLKLQNGDERKFLADNDKVIMRAWAEKEGLRIGFGECETKILPAK
ncbi:MAG: fumarylacetoacetase [Bacteroidales bacterium]